MRFKKQILIILICLFAAFSLVGCKDEELQAEDNAIREFAKQNSEEISEIYINEKYGIEAQMISYDLESDSSLFYSYFTGNVACIMEYDGAAFCCLYNIDDTTCISDNLQRFAIEQDIKSYLEEQCNVPSISYAEIIYSDTTCLNGMYVCVDGTEQYVKVENCIHEFYDGELGDLFDKLDYLKIEAEVRSDASIKDFVLDEQLSKVESLRIDLTNKSNDTEFLSSRCFNLKETLSVTKSRNGEITEDYVKIVKESVVDGFTVAYNGVSDFSSSVIIKEVDNELLEELQNTIDFEEYEIVSPLFYGVGDKVIVGGITAEIQIEDYVDYYIFKFYDDPAEGTMSYCSEFVELYKDSKVIFLRKAM